MSRLVDVYVERILIPIFLFVTLFVLPVGAVVVIVLAILEVMK